jgi:hypothetical protein
MLALRGQLPCKCSPGVKNMALNNTKLMANLLGEHGWRLVAQILHISTKDLGR